MSEAITPDGLDCPQGFPQPVNKDAGGDAHTFEGLFSPRPGRGSQQITPGSRRVGPGTTGDLTDDTGSCGKRILDGLAATSGLTLSAVLPYRAQSLFH